MKMLTSSFSTVNWGAHFHPRRARVQIRRFTVVIRWVAWPSFDFFHGKKRHRNRAVAKALLLWNGDRKCQSLLHSRPVWFQNYSKIEISYEF